MRKVLMIQEMFNDISSEEEKLRVQKLYQDGFKASAIVFMLKRIRAQWNVFVGKSSEVIERPRTIVVRENGSTRYIARSQ